jgi:hypothetical protein
VRVMRRDREVRFLCSKCGSAEFGSWEPKPGFLIRHCHGRPDGAPCRHKFPQTDDYLNFTVDGDLLPTWDAFEAGVYVEKPMAFESKWTP